MFSMITGCPSSALMPWPSARPKMSAGPPAGNGTIIFTGLVGYACAIAISGNSASTSTLSNLITPPPKPRLLIAAHGHPPIDHQLGTGDEARLVRCQEEHRVRRVAPVAGKAQRNALLAAREQSLDVTARALLCQARLDHRRVQLSRHHAVDADALRCILHGHYARKLDHARFRRRVRNLRRAAPADAGSGGDVH